MLYNSKHFKGLKSNEYPKDVNEQSGRAVSLMRQVVARVLGRDEEFSLSVKKVHQLRYVKDSTVVMVPPLEVKVPT